MIVEDPLGEEGDVGDVGRWGQFGLGCGFQVDQMVSIHLHCPADRHPFGTVV